MLPEHAGQRRLGGWGGSTYAAMPSGSRQRWRAALRLRLAKMPKWRMHQPAEQDVKQEAAQELMGGNRHDLLLAAMGIVSPAEGDAIVLKGHETRLETATRWV
jgi:hypothetical protein